MSRTHRYRDRGSDGKLQRKYRHRCRGVRFPHGTPKWWRKLFMTRPRRRQNTAACRRILRGEDSDAVELPVGNRKPHEYYW